jgi:hypothetical protein
LSQNVIVACDFNGQFVHAGARVLQDALAHGFYVSSGKFYLVGAAAELGLRLFSGDEKGRK